MRLFRPLILAGVITLAGQSQAEFSPEFATVEVLPENTGQQWFWLYGFRAPSMGDSRAGPKTHVELA